MAAAPAVVPIISAVAAVIGAGVAAYSAYYNTVMSKYQAAMQEQQFRLQEAEMNRQFGLQVSQLGIQGKMQEMVFAAQEEQMALQTESEKINAIMMRVQGKAAEDSSLVEESQYKEKAKRVLASQAAAIGASGITFEGSPLLVMLESQKESEKDIMNLRRQREMTSWGFGQQARLRNIYAGGGAGQSLLTDFS